MAPVAGSAQIAPAPERWKRKSAPATPRRRNASVRTAPSRTARTRCVISVPPLPSATSRPPPSGARQTDAGYENVAAAHGPSSEPYSPPASVVTLADGSSASLGALATRASVTPDQLRGTAFADDAAAVQGGAALPATVGVVAMERPAFRVVDLGMEEDDDANPRRHRRAAPPPPGDAEKENVGSKRLIPDWCGPKKAPKTPLSPAA